MAKRKSEHVFCERPVKKRKSTVKLSPKQENGKKAKWTNKQRVLVFSSRGVSYRSRHLMQDLKRLMPHSKSESKMDRKDQLMVINEVCEMKNCNKCIFFECKKKEDLYMWISNVPAGPSAKFLVENVHTMMELRMTGNCLTTSRPLLSFDKIFDNSAHFKLLKELFIQTFSTPNAHPKSQPFFDRVLSFSIEGNRVFIRHYQILEEDGSLSEIGPRFILNLIRVFDGSFGGATLYQNPSYVPPNFARRQQKHAAMLKYSNRLHQKKGKVRPENAYVMDPLDNVFSTE